MTNNEWIRNKLRDGVSTGQLRMMYKVFVKETGSSMNYDSYTRKVRTLSSGFRKKEPKSNESVKLKQEVEGADTTIVTESHNIRTVDQLLAYCRVDLDKYFVTKHVVNSWGSADNPSFQVKAWLSLKDEEPESDEDKIKSLISDAKKYAPKYPKPPKLKKHSGNALEISLFDHHFGQLSWGKETGDKNYNIQIAAEMALDSISDILSQALYHNPEQIIIPIGNDFFNVNDQTNTTQRGTPQSEDDRWQKTFVSGREIWVSILEQCRAVAPTKAMWIPGNHDPERSFHLCDSLYCWFRNSDIEIDHSPKAQKVVTWGDNAIFYTHGCNEKPSDYPIIFASMYPHEWSNAKYRSAHVADKHHIEKKGFVYHEDVYSIDVKIKPSLVPLNAWSSGKAYKAIARTEAEIWNKEKGLIGDLYHNKL